MGGLSESRHYQCQFQHSVAAIQSAAGAAVALSAVPLWVEHLVIQADDANPSGAKGLLGDSTITAASYGMFFYAGESFPWPFTGLIPLHLLYYLQTGGTGNIRWLALKRIPG